MLIIDVRTPELATVSSPDLDKRTGDYPYLPTACAARWGKMTVSLVAHDLISPAGLIKLSPSACDKTTATLEVAQPKDVALTTLAVIGGMEPRDRIPIAQTDPEVIEAILEVLDDPEAIKCALGVFSTIDSLFDERGIEKIASADGKFGKDMASAKTPSYVESLRAAMATRLCNLIDLGILESAEEISVAQRKAIARSITTFQPE